MKPEIKSVIEKYQCPGCVVGHNTECYEPWAGIGVGCGKHTAGTRVLGHPKGLFWLGLPKGFDRTGPMEHKIRPEVYEKLTDFAAGAGFDMCNVPVWKHRTKDGHILVRGLRPRSNNPFLHIYISDEGYEDIQCIEITEKDIEEMD